MNNKIKESVYLIGLTIVILIGFSYIRIEQEIAPNFVLKTVDLFSDIKDYPEDQNQQDLNLSVLPEAQKAETPVGQLFSSLINFHFEDADNSAMFFQGRNSPIVGNTKQLSFLAEALKTAKTKNVRIAHFGDSAIEGDLITADIRELLQKKYGGNGAGWLGIVSQDINFRMTTKHSFSPNWEAASLYSSNPKALPLGMSGEINIPKGAAWVKYETTRNRPYLTNFTVAKLYYSNAKASQISYSFDGGAAQKADLKTGVGIQELILTSKSRARSIKIDFPIAEQAYFYGVSLENEPGVYVDNFPLRGNSGVDLVSLQPSVLKEFAKYLDYKLIILEFGLNIAGAKTDYSWYEREMTKVISNLKSAFPKASIILFGVHDKASKKGSQFVTDEGIVKLSQTQKSIAEKSGVAFWSLFDAMGGENSMAQWVGANPPLAFKDYIHFNDQGAKKVAQLFNDALAVELAKIK